MPCRRSRASWWARKGRPATGTRTLGTRSVIGRKRVARPPARMATGKGKAAGMACKAAGKTWSGDHQLGPFDVEAEPNFHEAGLAHGVTEPRLVFLGVEHEEAAAPGADQLAAEGAAGFGQFVPLVDLRVGHAAAARLFALPMFIHERGEPAQVAALQSLLAGAPDFLRVMQVLQHSLVV